MADGMNILFICSSNACRSPYCEFVFRRLVDSDPDLSGTITVRSAGVLNPVFGMDHRTRNALLLEGFSKEETDAFHSTFSWTHPNRFREADVIIGMTKSHGRFLLPTWKRKFTTLSEAATGTYTAFPDPWFEPRMKPYLAAMEELKGYLEQYANVLKENQKT